MALVLFTSGAEAKGFYVAGHGGLNLAFDSDVDDSNQGIDKVRYDPGFAVGGAFGYKFDFQVRLEGDVTYRRNSVDDLKILGTKQGGDGNVKATSFMVNAFYDFDNSTRWTPYVGGGIGIARVQWDDVETSRGVRLDNTEYLGAAQLGGGVAFRVSERLELTADYRAFATNMAEFEDNIGDDIEVSYVTSSIMLGLRISF